MQRKFNFNITVREFWELSIIKEVVKSMWTIVSGGKCWGPAVAAATVAALCSATTNVQPHVRPSRHKLSFIATNDGINGHTIPIWRPFHHWRVTWSGATYRDWERGRTSISASTTAASSSIARTKRSCWMWRGLTSTTDIFEWVLSLVS